MVGDRVGVRPVAAMEGDHSPGVVMEEEEEVMALRITTDKRGAGDMVTEGAWEVISIFHWITQKVLDISPYGKYQSYGIIEKNPEYSDAFI